jgi:release factor glutamine methyltransferase
VFLDQICAEASAHLRPGGVMLLVHSSVCGEQATVSALSDSGLSVSVALRHRGALGPILRARADWLRDRQLLPDDGQEEMLVIRAEAPGGDWAAGRIRRAAQSTILAQPANRFAS